MIRILEESELRHVLAHLHLAIEELAGGHPEMALDDLRSIEGLVFYGLDDEVTEHKLRRHAMAKHGKKGKGRKGNPCKGR